MAKRQTRRSISVKGSTYRRLQILCARRGVSVCSYIELKVAGDIEGIEDHGASEPKPRPPKASASGIWTF